MEGLTLQATRTFSPSQNSLTWRRRSILSSKPRASALRFEPATNRNANISLLSSAISLQSNFFGHRVSSRPRLPEPTRAVNKPTVAADKPASAPVAWQGAKPVPLAISLAIGIIVRFLVPKPVEVTPQAWQLLSIFLSTIAGLVLSPLPVGAWAFLGLTTAVITRTLSFSAAFSAFTNEVIWLIVISFFFARGFVKTGLGDRIATYFVKWLGKSTLGLSYGLTVSEALIAPAMPSTTARAGGVFLPIIKSLSLSGGSLPNDKSSKKLGSYLIQSQFQIVNHGVPQIVMKNMMEIAKEFFEMPVEDRACLYSEDPTQTVRLSKSFTNKENVLNWRESLSHTYHPAVMNSWPENPAAYREIAAKYCMNIKALALRLLAAISEALGLDSDYLNTSFGKHIQSMVINYYPPCPNPDLTLGIPGHSDGSGITVLMQGDVDGLQVLKNGKWVAVQPIDNAFVINLGDLLQVVSNGRFKSVEHRAITNATTARISIPTFYSPSLDALIAPAGSMVDEQHPALYRGFKVEEFVRVAYGSELKCKKLLDHFKIEYPQDNGE